MAVINTILDYDGNLTDVKKESMQFAKEYPLTFAKYLNVDPERFVPLFEEQTKYTALNKSAGFIINGQDVSPAYSDPYLLIQSTAQRMAKMIKNKTFDPSFKIDPHIIDEDLGKMAETIYLNTMKNINHEDTTNFREGHKGTKKFLDTLLERGYSIAIVTASSTDKVNKQLSQIGPYESIIRVGHAGKLFVNPDFEKVPEYATPREIRKVRKPLLRRERYYNALESLKEKGFQPDQTAVIGDNYELDLALPEYLGYHTIQLKTEYTPEHEIKYHKRRGTPVTNNYLETLNALAQLK